MPSSVLASPRALFIVQYHSVPQCLLSTCSESSIETLVVQGESIDHSLCCALVSFVLLPQRGSSHVSHTRCIETRQTWAGHPHLHQPNAGHVRGDSFTMFVDRYKVQQYTENCGITNSCTACDHIMSVPNLQSVSLDMQTTAYCTPEVC